jgi:hypothetical protein
MTWRDFVDTAKASLEQTLEWRRAQVAEAEESLQLRRAQVAEAEDALARIESAVDNMTFIESWMASADNDPPPATDTEPEEAGTASAPDPEPVGPPSASTSAEADPDLTTTTRPLSENIQRTLQILASADQPMRAREVVQALGEPDRRSVVESTRTRLKRLVASGYLTEKEGMFRIARRVNGHPQEGAPITE